MVHLSPKAKALTLPLNWSQFLKTLIGAENYTLFQLPPNKTGVRPSPSSFTRYTLLPLAFSSFARFLPLGYFFFRQWAIVGNIEVARRRRASRAGGIFYCQTRREIGRAITGWSVDRLRDEVSVSEHLASIRLPISDSRHARDRSVPLRKKSTGLDARLKRSLAVALFNKLVVACRVKRCPIKSNSSVWGSFRARFNRQSIKAERTKRRGSFNDRIGTKTKR